MSSSYDPLRPESPGAAPFPAPAWSAAVSVPSAVRLPAVSGESLLPPTPASTPNALDLLKALRRRWVLALTLSTLGVATVAPITWWLVPPSKYRARAVFLVASTQPQIIFKTSEARADFATYQQTQVNLIKSQRVLNRAINLTQADITEFLKKKGLLEGGGDKSWPASEGRVRALKTLQNQANPVAWLQNELQVDRAGETLGISLSGSRREDLAPLINAIAQAYEDVVINRETKDRDDRLKELELLYNGGVDGAGVQVTGYQVRLKAKRENLKKLVRSAGSSDKETRAKTQQLAVEQLAMAQKDLMQLQSELRRAVAKLKFSKDQSRGRGEVQVTNAAIEKELAKDQYISSYTAKLSQLTIDLTNTRAKVRLESDAAIQDLVKRQKGYQAGLDKRRKQMRPVIEKHLREGAVEKPDEDTGILRAEVGMLEELVALTAKEVETLSRRSETLTTTTQDLESEQAEIAHADTAAKKIGDEIEALKVELKAKPRVQLFEPAEAPRLEDERRQLKMAGLSGAGIFAFILLGVSWFEFRARRIDSADEVVHALGMRIMGTLPAMPDRVRRRAAGSSGTPVSPWYRLLIESVDATRTMLLHAANTESYRIIMVTSALGGEGKTSLSSHLASSLARAGRRTLLVDCDLRNPAAHRLFDLTLEPGVCDLLRGEVDLIDAIRPTAINGLSMITAGSCDGRAIQGLAQDGVRAIFDRLRDQFDFVVVDSAPVLPVADSLLLCQHVDAVIFSILRDVSRVTKVYAAHTLLAALGTRTMGAIVTGVRSETYGSDYAGYGKDYAA